MAPGDCYVLAIVATALLVAPFCAMARIIVLSWIIAHVAFVAGVPEAWVNLGGQLCVAVLGRRHILCPANAFAWGCALVLVAVNAASIAGATQPVPTWQVVLTVAFIQLMALPFAIDRETLKTVTRAWYDSTGGLFRLRHAK